MKTKNLAIVIAALLTSSVLYAQKVEVNVNESNIEWVGKKIGGQHDGHIQLKSGSIEIKKKQIVAGSFVIDMASITNADLKDEGYNQKLVGHMKSDDFFGVDKFPTAKLVITEGSQFSNGKATIVADITIKGKTESISFDIMETTKGYSSKIEIDRSKFDVRYGSNSFFDNLGDKAIEDIFILNVNLVTK